MDVEEWGVFLWALIAPVISLLVLVGLLLFILLRRRKKRQAYEALLKETYGDRYVPDNPPKPKAKPKATSPDEQTLMKYCLSNLAFECEFPVVLENIEDEIKREAAFARQALVAAAFARRIVMAAKIPFSRPDGYFCEMLKTEEHMKKISERITEEKEATKAAEQARKQRMNRKFGKRIQVEREQEKQQKVTKDKKSLNLLRKRKRDERDDEFKIDLEEDTGYETEGKRRNHGGGRRKEERTISKKRQAKNEKYGWGGKKHGKKRNNKESADQDEFNVSRNRRPFNNNSIKKSHKKQRPGKTRRQAIRHRKASRK